MSDIDELFKCIKDQPESWPAEACHYAKVDEDLIKDYDWIETVHLRDKTWGALKLHVLKIICNDGSERYIGAEVYEFSGNNSGEFELSDLYEIKKEIVQTHKWVRT